MLATNNANLSCILVDDKDAASTYALWQKDANARYGTTCNVPTSSNAIENNVFKVYPNPSNGDFTIELSENAKIYIYDATGKLVLNKQVNQGVNSVKLVVSPNLYFLQIVTNSGIQTHKIIIE